MITFSNVATIIGTQYSRNGSRYILFKDAEKKMWHSDPVVSVTQTINGCVVILADGSVISFLPF